MRYQVTEQENGKYSVYTDTSDETSMADERLVAFDLTETEAQIRLWNLTGVGGVASNQGLGKTMNEEVQTAIAERDQARAARDMQEKSKINAEVERDGLKESLELLKNELQEARQDRRDLKDALLSFAWFVLNECLVNDTASMKVLHDKARALLGNWS